MAIAANWLSWPKVGRVALLQATITALVLLAWWQGKNKPNDWTRAHSLSSLSLSLAAIAVGGVLALIGQSYPNRSRSLAAICALGGVTFAVADSAALLIYHTACFNINKYSSVLVLWTGAFCWSISADVLLF